MRKKTILSVFALALLAGCSDNTYEGATSVVEEENLDPMPVLLSVGKPEYSVTTKATGSGAIDPNDPDNKVWENAKIYVYAFQYDPSNTANPYENSDFSQMMLPSIGENVTPPLCLIDGSRDNFATKLGKEATINIGENYLAWTALDANEQQIYFPSSKEAYKFYAYYIDDLTTNLSGNEDAQVERTSDKIVFRDLEIDGSQDVMTAIADLTTDQDQDLKSRVTAEEYKNVKNSLYSSYAARRQVQPTMYFKHHLARLKFKIYPGAAAASNVWVKSITVDSKTKGDLTVVSKDGIQGFDFSSSFEYKTLELMDKEKQPLRQDLYHVIWDDVYAGYEKYDDRRNPMDIGESLLVAPTTGAETGKNGYQFAINLVQKEAGKPEIPFTSPQYLLPPTGTTSFEAGKQYVVRIMIYGMQNVKIEVYPESWIPGGDVPVDPDDFK